MKKLIIPVAAALALGPALAQAKSEPIGITRAVAIAEKSTGATATDAELDARRDGTLVYEVELATAQSLHEVDIDAKTGKILAKRTPRFASYWARWFDGDEINAAARTRPLSQLLSSLEQRTAGKVREVSFDIERGQPRYEVEIATAAGVTEIYLDPKTGERLSLVYDD